jgi:uncharacterized FlaG/YvyC family protein
MNISSIGNSAHIPAPTEPSPARPLTDDQRTLIQAVKAVNAAGSFGPENETTYKVDRSTRQLVVRVVNRKTNDVVLQIPAEYVLRMAEELNGR